MQRSLEWFWGAPPPELKNPESASFKAVDYERRARVAAELARRALEPPEPFADGQPDALACGLYHQSILWSLRSLNERRKSAPIATNGDKTEARVASEDRDSDAPNSDAPNSDAPNSASAEAAAEPQATASFSELWDAAAMKPLLAAANLTAEEVNEVKRQMAGSSFEDYSDLPSSEQVRWGRKLRVVAEGLIYGIEVTSGRYSPPWLSRALRIGLLLVLVIGVGWGGFAVREWMIELNNVARGKPWTTSSTYAAPGCRSPAQECMESPNFFFHTQEENGPWLELDLGTVQSISSVKIRNREDCCSERAVPLVVEVSTDGKQWKQVARKNEIFGVWHPEFPAVDARWVRLRVARKSILHLASVDVYR